MLLMLLLLLILKVTVLYCSCVVLLATMMSTLYMAASLFCRLLLQAMCLNLLHHSLIIALTAEVGLQGKGKQ